MRMPATGLPSLKPVELLVLVELLAGNRHGYGIVGAVEESTEGAVRLVPGNLYRVLQRLLDRRWIEETEGGEPGDDERRKYYRLTATGREMAANEVDRLQGLAALGRRALRAGSKHA